MNNDIVRPGNSSYPAILGDLLCAGLAVQGMMWSTSPACTEIETKTLDWLASLIHRKRTSIGYAGERYCCSARGWETRAALSISKICVAAASTFP